MKMFEMKRDGVYGIGFIDPNTVNAEMVEQALYKEDTKKSLLMFLKELNTNADILLPYNFK